MILSDSGWESSKHCSVKKKGLFKTLNNLITTYFRKYESFAPEEGGHRLHTYLFRNFAYD